LPAPDPADHVSAERYVAHESAACVTVYVPPATVIVPVRVDPVVFAAMVNATEPGPVEFAPLVMVSQDALLVAVQAQPAGVVTLTLPLPAAAAADNVFAEREVVHASVY
jgi:hypothetical protein